MDCFSSPNVFPLLDTMKIFVENVGHISNSMLTTDNFDIEESRGNRHGYVQLKWWKETGTLIIKEVFLSPHHDYLIKEHKSSYVVDHAAKYILQSMPQVKRVVIESPADYLVTKYKLKHWKHNSDRNELFLEEGDPVFNM
jgi:hypothetical protein